LNVGWSCGVIIIIIIIYCIIITLRFKFKWTHQILKFIWFTVWPLGGSKVIPVSSVQKRGASSRGDSVPFRLSVSTFTVHSRQSQCLWVCLSNVIFNFGNLIFCIINYVMMFYCKWHGHSNFWNKWLKRQARFPWKHGGSPGSTLIFSSLGLVWESLANDRACFNIRSNGFVVPIVTLKLSLAL
jgi:hypothetical protein